MAELLCKAVDAWGDSPERSMKGDVIVVRPDGWVWGREECPPRFVIIKVPDMTLEEAKKYEQPLMVDDGVDTEGHPKQKMAKVRKYAIPVEDVEEAKKNNGVLVRTKAEKLAKIKEKTS
jgi:hypothetical protein